MGYSLWGHKESDTTEQLTHTWLPYDVLVSAIQKSESAIHLHMSPLLKNFLPF